MASNKLNDDLAKGTINNILKQAGLIPIQYEDEHNLEVKSLAIKGFNLIYYVQLHIHLV